MFVLAKFKYTVKTLARDFGVDIVQNLIDSINAEFSNYVIIDVGLCITFYDFVKIGDSFLMPGESDSYTPVEFRYVVFQPFRGEILQGTIASCGSDGIRVSMSFFCDIHITPDKLPKVSKFDENEQLWYWEYVVASEDEEDAKPQMIKFFMEPGKVIRFRVIDYKFRSVEPGSPKDVKVYEIIASISETGLGCLSWWEGDEEAEEEQMEIF
ncbi:hypothetical protein M3Y95_00177400 [Aphelenchoides besseyi]|nr:hypothetical protein M3Y95_00177400 [Aphelenchoides besseyi]